MLYNHNTYEYQTGHPPRPTSGPPRHTERPRSSNGTSDSSSLTQRLLDFHERVNSAMPPSQNERSTPHSPWARGNIRTLAAPTSHLQRHRMRRQREDDALGTVQDAVDRLNEANSSLNSVLDRPLPQIITADEFAASLVADAVQEGRTEYIARSVKRRKLDADSYGDGKATFYGHYGQVVPGRLKMSLMSCDGGQLTERDDNMNHHRSYWPENILRNDKSVYCTEKDQCNIILGHGKETPFTVTKIVIKTPDAGFTAPVQEGLIFVAMNLESLLSRTERYRIRSSPVPRLPSAASVYPESHGQHTRVPTAAFSPPRPTWTHRTYHNMADARPPSRRRYYPSAQVWHQNDPYPPQPPPREAPNHDEVSTSFEATQSQQSQQSETPTAPLDLQPGYRVTTTSEDPSGDEEDPTEEAILHDRQRRSGHALGPDMYSSDSEVEQFSSRRHRRLRSSPRKIELEPIVPEPGRTPDILVPHARFFIEKKRNVVSIKFDPPM